MTDTPRPRIPELALPAAGGDETIATRAHRRASVLVLVDEVPDARTEAWLAALAAHEGALRDWDGRVVVVAPAPHVIVPATPFPVAVDERGRVAAAAGVAAPALVVADQWGEVHVAAAATDGGWMAPAEVEQWLRMLAIRCAG